MIIVEFVIRTQAMFRFERCEVDCVYSMVTRSKPKEGMLVVSDTEDILKERILVLRGGGKIQHR